MLHDAAEHGNVAATTVVLSSPEVDRVLNERNAAGSTALHLALERGRIGGETYLLPVS